VRRVSRKLGRWLALSAVVLIILIGALVGAARIGLPAVDEWLEPQLASQLSDLLQRPVRTQGLRLAWVGRGPVARVSGLQVLESGGEAIVVDLGDATVGLDVLGSLLQRRLVVGEFWLEGITLHVREDADGGLRLGTAETQAWEGEVRTALMTLSRFRGFDLYEGSLILHPADAAAQPRHYRNVNLSVRNVGRHRELGLSLTGPSGAGERLVMRARIEGPHDQPEDWRIVAHADLHAVDLAALPVPEVARHFRSGAVTGGLWVEGTLRGVEKVEGGLGVAGLGLSAHPAVTLPDGIDTSFLWTPDANGWTLIHDWVRVRREAGGWSMPGLMVRGEGADWRHPDSVAVEISRVPLGALSHWKGLLPAGRLSGWAQSLAMRGEARDLRLQWSPGAAASDLRGSGRVEGLGYDPVGRLPGLDGLDADLALDGLRARLRLDGTAVTMTSPRLFRNDIPLDRLSGVVDMALEGRRWWVESKELTVDTPDIETVSRLRLDSGEEGEPGRIDLQVHLQNGEAGAVSRYLPVGIMRDRLVRWLDRSLVRGRIPSGGLILRGPLQGFPYRDQSGLFLAEVGFEDAILDYHPHWPRVEELDAALTFRGAGLEAEARHGRLLDLSPGRTWADIPELSRSILNLRTQVDADATSMMAFVNAATPLRERIGRALDVLSISGPASLEVGVSLPLTPKPQVAVEGELSFEDGRLALRNHDIELAALRGRGSFTEREFKAEGLQGVLWGNQATLDVHSRREPEGMITTVTLRGAQQTAELLRRYQPALVDYATGISQWQADLKLPGPDGGFYLDLNSSLEGTEITAPDPLGKPASDTRPLRMAFAVDGGGPARVEGEYGPIRAGASFDALAKGARPRDTSILVGPGELEPAAGPGVTLTGRLEFLDLDQWRPYLDLQSAGGSAMLDRLDLAVGEARAGDFSVRGVRARVDPASFRIDLDDAGLRGSLTSPRPLGSGPVEARFERVNLNLDPDKPRKSVQWPHPGSLPPVQLRIDHLAVDGGDLGSLEARSTPGPSGSTIDQLVLSGRHYTLSGTGSWTRADTTDRTAVTLNFEADDAGDAFAQLGLGAASSGGTATGTLDLGWPEPLPDIGLESLQGSAELSVLEGLISDVDPGVGRLVGLFNFSAIGRRLALDFTDVFDEGYRFDSITAQLRFDDGTMYEDLIESKGPSAHLVLNGRVGIIDRDYDLELSVTPQVGGTLAVAGMLAGGPVAGAALFIAGKVFKGGIDRVVRVRYAITGSWEDPVIEPVHVVPFGEEEEFGQEGGSR
jgi:uncharacterized protein (TIGR02099 family)